MKKKLLLLIFAISIAYLTQSCRETPSDNLLGNREPETNLFLQPDSSGISQQKSRLTVHWWGDDPDGLIIGYYYKWEGIQDNWSFTTQNSIQFSLPIGTVDTNYNFKVTAIDNSGNGKYDNSVIRNGINYGAEPFIDANNNNIYDDGEVYMDVGAIDKTPATLDFPIKNSPPEIEWDDLSILPTVSFPVVTVGWATADIDGDETIININLALNDTLNPVQLKGSVKLVTLRYLSDTEMEILIGGDENDINTEKLQTLRVNDNNRLYIQAKDISGATSPFIPLPDTSQTWFVKKPSGRIVIVDDYEGNITPPTFYSDIFNNLRGGALTGKFDVLDIQTTNLPYPNLTFLHTLKLWDYIFWYSDFTPSLEIASIVTQKFINGGGKIAFSMTFQDSTSNYAFDFPTVQNFLPIDSLGQKKPVGFVFPGANLLKSNQSSVFPALKTSTTVGFVRTFYPSSITTTKIYDLSSSQINGNIAFIDNNKDLFFVGLPLNQCNANPGTVELMFDILFFDEFGYQP